MRVLTTTLAMLLLIWQATIHFIAIVLSRDSDGKITKDVGWFLDPSFSSWVQYDVFWFLVLVYCIWTLGRMAARERVLTEVVKNIHKWREEFFGPGNG